MRSFIFSCALIAYTMAAAVKKPVTPLEAVLDGSNQFSTNFFKTVLQNKSGNLVTSPLSADLILSMASYGALDSTKKQMQDVLRIPTEENLAKSGYQNLIDTLTSIKEVDIKLANKIFANNNFELKQEFKTLTKESFRSEEQQVDFAKSDDAAKIINTWCEEKTNNKIKNLIAPGDLSASTSLVLVNTVYFNGKWFIPFDPKSTENKDFHVDEKTVKKVPTMNKNIYLMYGELPNLDAKFVELPYKGEEVSMIIVLPNKIDGLQQVQTKLESLNINTLRQQGKEQTVELFLPKFKIESSIDLNNVLTKMGMGEMFTDKANFRNIADTNLKVDKVVQKAVIEVNEEGTEAAASTFIIMAGSSPNIPPTFAADRPFFYFVTFRSRKALESSVILFSGILKDPTL